MTVIYKKDTGRLKVAETKRLIIEAMPDDEPGYVAFSGTVDAYGIDHWDIDNPKHQTYRETVQFRLNNSFLDLCREAGFEPHLSIDPSTKGYRLSEVDDRLYMITHAQFVKLAEAFSLTVVVGDEPATTPAPVVADGDAPTKHSNRKPSWATVAMPYMKSLFTAGNYRSAPMFYEALMRRTSESDSPFKLVNHELYCTEAGTTVSKGSLANVWSQIRAH